MAPDARRSLFLDLPRELLDNILQDYTKSRRDLFHVRLVCRALDDVAKHAAVKKVHLEQDLISSIQSLLDLGSSAFTTCTTNLLIGPDEFVEGIQEEDLMFLNAIVRAHYSQIPSLWFTFYNLHTMPRLIQAIGKIPHLKSLSLEKMHPLHFNCQLMASALANAHQLEHLAFDVRHLVTPEHADAAQKQARALVVACTNLESLEIGRFCASRPTRCSRCKFELDVSDILSGIACSTLRTLKLRNGVNISSSSPSTLDCLLNLTSLSVPNSHEGQQPLWPILSKLGIKLLSLTVESGSKPLLQYLLSFEGLKEFLVGEEKTGSHIDQGMEQGILFEGLSHHRVTLEQISLLPSHLCHKNPPITCIQTWAMDCDNIPGWLEQFARLKILGLAIYVDNQRLVTCMEPVIRALTSGRPPSLTNVTINIGEARPQSFPIGNPTLIAETAILSSFLDFPLRTLIPQENWSQLSIITFLCHLYVENMIPLDFWMEKQPDSGLYAFKTTYRKMRIYRVYLRTETWKNRRKIFENEYRGRGGPGIYNTGPSQRR